MLGLKARREHYGKGKNGKLDSLVVRVVIENMSSPTCNEYLAQWPSNRYLNNDLVVAEGPGVRVDVELALETASNRQSS